METRLIAHIGAGDWEALKEAFIAYYAILYRDAWEQAHKDPADSVERVFRDFWLGGLELGEASLLDTLSQHLKQLEVVKDIAQFQKESEIGVAYQALPLTEREQIERQYFEPKTNAQIDWQQLGRGLGRLSKTEQIGENSLILMAKYHAAKASPQEEANLRYWVDEDPTHVDSFEAVYELNEALNRMPEATHAESAWEVFAKDLPASTSENSPPQTVSKFSLRMALWLLGLILLGVLLVRIGLSF